MCIRSVNAIGVRVIGVGTPQYTSRGKKTLMVIGECTYCGTRKLFRKARIDSGQTKSCWCLKLKKIAPWTTYSWLTVLMEAPRMRNRTRSRQLYVECKCWNKTLVPIKQWWTKKTCGCKPNCQVKNKLAI